ncbi:MAG: hypothetical protein K6E51_04470 [Treponema sp.]|nr:hypothetical protein [Treponema sp.]
MAFVSVIRRSLRPEEWTDLRYGYLKRGIIKDKEEILCLTIKDRLQTGENEYTDLSDWRALHKDDIIFTPDGTVLISGMFTIPERFFCQQVYLQFHTAAEMIVKINGQFAGGLDPNRERIDLTPFITVGENIVLEMEGYNRSKPDDERNPDAMNDRGCRQIFSGIYMVVLNQPVLDLFYDLTALIDIGKSPYFDDEYRKMLNVELDAALNYVDFDTFTGATEAREYLQKKVFNNKTFHSSGDVALIGHSHLDIAYYWRRIHTVQKNARTILIQMRLMDKYKDFKYCHTQPYLYETLEKYYPELFAELKKKIASGQFECVGAMYVEPDCNIPAAESLIRQCLYGQLYYRKTFGITVDSAWLPDVFGNSWILPQILKKSGVTYFVSNKMSTWNDTNRFPHNNFVWKGIDGTKIAACVPPTHFITWNMPSQVKENWDAFQDKETGTQTLSMFGYGDGGSGATEEMIELMHRFDNLSIMPHTEHVRAGTFLQKNFTDLDKFETWDGELYLEMHRGTFTTKSVLKRLNRKLEFKLRDAEILSLCRLVTEHKTYPVQTIQTAYKKLMLNQFHDILPGSHINPVFQDAIKDFTEIEATVDTVIDSHKGYLFNSLNHDRNDVIFIADEMGPFVRKGKKGYFAQVSIPALHSVVEPVYDPSTSENTWLTVVENCGTSDTTTVETPYYRLRFTASGAINSLQDKNTGFEYVAKELNALHLYQDVPGMYDSWDILPNYKDVEYDLSVSDKLHFVQADDTCAEFVATLQTPHAKSTWQMIVRVFKNSPAIEVEHCVDWNEKHRLAKVHFSVNALSRELVCDTSAGYIKRECHRNTSWQKARFEVCMHKWCDFSEETGGVAVINDGKYGAGVEEDGFSVSLLRSNIRPDIMSDIGYHDMVYQIYPHQGSFIEAKVNESAFNFNEQPVPVQTPYALDCSFPGLFLQAAKLSEDGKYIIYRLSEQNGRRGVIQLDMTYMLMNMLEDVIGQVQQLSYAPFELLTIAKPIAK